MNHNLAHEEKPLKALISAIFDRYQEKRKPHRQAAFRRLHVHHLTTSLCDENVMLFIMRFAFIIQGQAAYAEISHTCVAERQG